MRIDRAISMFIASYRQSGDIGSDGKIPILMYHSISPANSGGAYQYYETTTSPAQFARHMEILRELEYTVVRLKDLDAAFVQKRGTKKKISIITFDDGYADFYETAFPVLRSFDFPATVFVPTAFIGAYGTGIDGKKHLSWQQIRDLHLAGVDFGSHTVNHPQLADLTIGEILHQMRESKKIIEENLGTAIDTFAYPFAFPEGNRKLMAVLRRLLIESGYHIGVCTSIGRASPGDDRLFLKRLPVNTFDDDSFFRAKLEGAYDWLHAPQVIYKRLKNII
jgi:peptidoglycan/xylan/chitin deacetylase (PgdA/CDA1 family)